MQRPGLVAGLALGRSGRAEQRERLVAQEPVERHAGGDPQVLRPLRRRLAQLRRLLVELLGAGGRASPARRGRGGPKGGVREPAALGAGRQLGGLAAMEGDDLRDLGVAIGSALVQPVRGTLVQLAALGARQRLIRDVAHELMAEAVDAGALRRALLDQLAARQLLEGGGRLGPSSCRSPTSLNVSPSTAAVRSARFSAEGSRSIRPAIAACTVSGSDPSAAAPPWASPRAISSTKKGLPAPAAAIAAADPAASAPSTASASAVAASPRRGVSSSSVELRAERPQSGRRSRSSGRAVHSTRTGAS